ncbi:MAG: hypothetical protein ACK4JA_02890 [Parazoarcus communis]
MKWIIARPVRLAFALTATGMLALYASLVADIYSDNPAMQIACIDNDPPPLAWTCKTVLALSLTEKRVAQLNAAAGAILPMRMRNQEHARATLQILLDRGLDIDAVDLQTQQRWTALHLAAMEEPLWPVIVLLEHGARSDLRDTDDMTPLDRARSIQASSPSEQRKAIIEHLKLHSGG